MSGSGGNSGVKSGIQAAVVTRDIGELMDGFDRLPLAHRRVIRDAPYNVDTAGVGGLSLERLRATLVWLRRESVATTYGPDHPQAK